MADNLNAITERIVRAKAEELFVIRVGELGSAAYKEYIDTTSEEDIQDNAKADWYEAETMLGYS